MNKRRSIPYILKCLSALGIILLLSLKCGSSPTEVNLGYSELKILFIGSSYLSYNNLPGMFQRLTQECDKPVYIETEIINRDSTYEFR